MDLAGKNVVLTGASKGIGRELLHLLLDEGANVLGVSRSIEKDSTLSHERLKVKNADLSRPEEVDAVFAHAIATFGRIDVFVANAGFTYYELLERADWEHIRSIMDVNATSVIYSAVKMRELYPSAPFVFMATLSAVSFLSLPGYGLYSATKAALRGFFDAFEHELSANQKLLRVYPVSTETAFFEEANQKNPPPPVQPASHVAEKMLVGLKKEKTHIYPSRLFKWIYRLFPRAYGPYLKKRRKELFAALGIPLGETDERKDGRP